MGRSTLFTSLILSLVGWGVVAAPNDATEETVMLRNHLLPGVDYERDPAPAPHLVLVTNSRDGRPPVFQLDTVHMNMAEQFGVLGVIAGQGNPPDNHRDPGSQRNPDGQRNTGSQRNPDGQRNTGSQRNPDGQRNTGSQRNPDGQRNTGSQRNPDGQRNTGSQRNPDGQRNTGSQRNPDGQRNTGSQRNPDGQRNTGSQRNPDGQRNTGSRRNPESRTRTEQGSYRREQTDEMHRYNWWRT